MFIITQMNWFSSTQCYTKAFIRFKLFRYIYNTTIFITDFDVSELIIINNIIIKG